MLKCLPGVMDLLLQERIIAQATNLKTSDFNYRDIRSISRDFGIKILEMGCHVNKYFLVSASLVYVDTR